MHIYIAENIKKHKIPITIIINSTNPTMNIANPVRLVGGLSLLYGLVFSIPKVYIIIFQLCMLIPCILIITIMYTIIYIRSQSQPVDRQMEILGMMNNNKLFICTQLILISFITALVYNDGKLGFIMTCITLILV